MLLVSFCLALSVPSTTWYVDAAGTAPGSGTLADPYTRIDYALSRASTQDGDIVLVRSGNYLDEAIDFAGKAVHVLSENGYEDTLIIGLGAADPSPHPLVSFVQGEGADSILEGFTLRAGSGGLVASNPPTRGGGAVFIENSHPTLRNCQFENNSGPGMLGGAVYAHGPLPLNASLRIENCGFANNNAGNGFGGALYLDNLRVHFVAGRLDQSGSGNSGAIYAAMSEVTFESTVFTNNHSGANGGAGFFIDCPLVLEQCQIEGGFSSFCGAGFWISGGSLSTYGCTFSNNSSTCGGALYLDNVLSTLTDTHFASNVAAEFEEGGAIVQLGGQLSLTACSFTDNHAGEGGAIHARATLLNGQPNPADFLHLAQTRFEGNRAESFKDFVQPRGGAIHSAIALTATGCTFEDNGAHFPPAGASQETAEGGALFTTVAAALDHCTLHANWAQAGHEARGGAIAAYAPFAIERSILTHNAIFDGLISEGGAWYGPIDAEFCTLRDNTGPDPSGSVVHGGTLSNSLVWGNTPLPLGPAVIVRYSVIEGGANGVAVSDSDPRFWGADDHQLLPSSTAINRGDPASPLDADGTRADMGALPFDPLHCGPGCDGLLGSVYCTSTPNSRGLLGRLTALGSDQLANDLLILHAFDLPVGMPGYFVGARGTDFVPGFGGSQGILCLGAPEIVRFNLAILNTGPAGQFTAQLSPNHFPDGHFVLPGQTWYFQAWYRDFVGLDLTSNTSEALGIQFP